MKVTLYTLMTLFVCFFSTTALSKDPEKGAGSNYKEITPAFLVNLPDSRQVRIMQINIAVESSNPDVLAAIDTHEPLIRNNLIMLFAAQTKEVVRTREGREKLRADAEEVINKALKEVSALPIDALYFTGLVVQ